MNLTDLDLQGQRLDPRELNVPLNEAEVPMTRAYAQHFPPSNTSWSKAVRPYSCPTSAAQKAG